MDLSKPVAYRGYPVNTLIKTGRILKGVLLEQADYSNVDATGYMEKRAAGDGMHASDVYLGARYIDLAGFVYQPTLAELFDALHIIRAAFSPTGAFTSSPGDQGFLPLTFSQPTSDAAFPGVINLQMLARPQSNVRFTLSRDRMVDMGLVDGIGTKKSGLRATVVPWSVRLICKDPRIYVVPEQEQALLGVQTVISKTALNRGDYETPMNMTLVPNGASTGVFHLTELNGIDMTITIPAKAGAVYRWYGDDRVLLVQDTPTSAQVLRMDLVTFVGLNRKPLVPPGNVGYKYSHTVDLKAPSRLWWNEAFA